MAVSPVVEVTHAFGSACGVLRRNSLVYGDENGEYLVNPVGRQVAFRRIDTNEMNLVIESVHVEAVTACAVSHDRSLFAVCERCSREPFTQVSVYDLSAPGTKPAQTLEELGGAVGRIVCASFSPEENANLLCLVSVEMLLVVLDWRRNRVVGKHVMDALADQVAMSPLDPNVVSVSGEKFIELWTVQEAEMVVADFSVLDKTPYTVTDHAWMQPGDGTLALCTGEGPIYILNSQDMSLVSIIDSAFELSGDSSEGLVPLCIRCFCDGFVVGTNQGTVAIWKRDEDEDASPPFLHERTVCVRRAEPAVCCIDVVEVEETEQIKIAFGFDDAHIGHTSMGTLLKGFDDLALCSIVSGGFHTGAITALDLAAQRPIIASMCQEDSSVRIWNYALRKCELCWTFPDEDLTSIAIHPFGYFLAVSFSDKLRFFQILSNELKPYRELSNRYRGIRLIKFSNGGHLLAAAQGKLVIIINTTTMQRVTELRGHSQHVTSLCFDPADQVLLTCGEDGSLFEWSTQGWNKDQEHFARSSQCLAIAAGRDGYSCCSLVEGSRSLLQSKKHCKEDQEIQLEGDMQIDALCYQSAASAAPGAAVVLAGTSTGMLWIYQSDLSLATCERYGLHSSACRFICLSADARTAVTAGDDGAIFVLTISGISPEPEGLRRGDTAKTGAQEIVMINRGEMQVRMEEFQLLDAENSALQTRLSEEAARLEGECKSRVEKARKKDQEEIGILRQTYESLQATATAKERENLRVLKTIEASHMQAADQLEVVYDKKITSEADRYVAVEAAVKALEKRIEVKKEDAQAELEQVRLGHQEDLRRQVAEKEAEIQKLKDLLAFSQHRFDTMLDQEGMEHDLEVAELKRQQGEEVEQQKTVEYKLKKEQDTLLRGLDKMEHDRDQISKEQMETKMTMKDLEAKTSDLTRNVKAMKEERTERERTLREKELQIGAYRVKVNTLNKFKHVLDFRLREVTQSLKPKDQMIESLNADLVNLEAEFERQLEMQHKMETVLQEKDQQIKDCLAESERLRQVIKQRSFRIHRFHEDLHRLVKEEQDLRNWPQQMKVIYRDHMNPECIAKGAENAIPMEELHRQTKLMEKKVSLLASNKSVTEARCRQDIQAKTTENSLLIHELNILRVERTALQRQVKDLDLRVRHASKPDSPLPPLEDKGSRATSPAGLKNSPSDGTMKVQDIIGGIPSGSGLPAETRRPLSGKAFSATRRGGPARTTWQHAGGAKKQRPDNHVPPEDRRKMQQLLAKADLNQQQVEMQALENKILRDQVHKLEAQRTADAASGTLEGMHVAGAAHKAVRQAGR